MAEWTGVCCIIEVPLIFSDFLAIVSISLRKDFYCISDLHHENNELLHCLYRVGAER
jgi:hypothetical protein